MEEKTKVPKLRFPGFTDDWEQRKLKNFGKATGGTSIESEFSDDGKYKVISIGSYSEDSVYRDQGIRAIESEKTKNRVLNEGDLTMILNDKTASGNIIGRALLIEKSGVYVYNQRTERIEINHEKFDSLFIYEMLNAPNVRDKIIKQSQGNTQIYVNWPTIAETDYLVPKIEEQRYLGKFFYNLDNLITLHQRKLDNLKNLKKGCLQKMFPRYGATKPELRFPGFTDDWEQRKLSEIADVIDPHPSHRAPAAVESGIPFIGIGDVDEVGNIDYSTARIVDEKIYDEHHKRYDLSIPSIGIGRVASLGKVIRLRNDIGKYAVSPTMSIIQFDSSVNGNYMYSYMTSPKFQKQFSSQSNGSTRQSVGIQDLRELLVELPVNMNEQKEIGHFFWDVDSLITLHQRKLDELNQFKKGMLQQMFV